MTLVKRMETFVAGGTDEEDHVACYAVFCGDVFEHVFAECRLDFGRVHGYMFFGVDDDAGRKS